MTHAMIRTIAQMEKLYYTPGGVRFLNPDDLQSTFVTKDAPVISTTTGVYNAIYGMQAWLAVNQEANTLGALPMSVWTRSGWRVISARADTLPAGGRAENADLPATVKPTFVEVSTKPKTHAQTFSNSETQQFLTDSDDDAYGSMDELRAYMAGEHREDMNAALNVQNGTVAGNNLESVDRIAGSYDEVTNGQENDQSTGYTTNDLDVYGAGVIDRDGAASWSDAYVSHNTTTGVRTLTDSLLNTLVQNTLSQGANPKGQWFQTGYDTWAKLNLLYEPQVRYNIIGVADAQVGVNGISTLAGQGVGLQVATLFGRAVIESKDTVTETGGIGRIYLFDTSNPEGFDSPRLYFRVAKPAQYFETGISAGAPFAVNRFGNEGMHRTMGEVICKMFKAQGKLRDLK